MTIISARDASASENRADNFGNLGAEDRANKTVRSPRSSAPSAMKSRIGQTSQTVPAVNSSKFFSHFPHGTCLLSVSGSYLALRGVYLALWASLPQQPDSCPKVFSGNQSSAYSKTAYLTHLNKTENPSKDALGKTVKRLD